MEEKKERKNIGECKNLNLPFWVQFFPEHFDGVEKYDNMTTSDFRAVIIESLGLTVRESQRKESIMTVLKKYGVKNRQELEVQLERAQKLREQKGA